MCDVEEIPIDYVNTAMERLVKNDVHYRQARSPSPGIVLELAALDVPPGLLAVLAVPSY